MSAYPLLFKLLSRMDPETAHDLAVLGLSCIPRRISAELLRSQPYDPRLHVDAMGLHFPNPIGMAAGFDKDADCFEALLALGFGHVEVGTVTPIPQKGNARPRIWRYPKHKALVNAMGFPGSGMIQAAMRLYGWDRQGVVGVNIGMNKDTPHPRDDYFDLAQEFKELADYICINVSSPNTEGLRDLEHASKIGALVRDVVMQARPVPVVVKLSPDMTDEQLAESATVAVNAGASGIVATNTTVNRRGLHDRGGLSGQPLRHQANWAMQVIYQAVGDRDVTLIGVGGIGSAADVIERIEAGAHLVQLYTSFIYEGPMLARRIVKDLLADADHNGWKHLHELRGTSVRLNKPRRNGISAFKSV